MNLTDPSGRIAIVPVLALAWAAFEVASTVLDAVETARTVLDPEASAVEKLGSAGMLVAGIGLPGSGKVYRAVGDAVQGTVQVVQGTKVYRVWGGMADAWGRSWTTVDPRTISNYRDRAGLPDTNTGRFVSEGIIIDPQGVTVKRADPLHGNRGGLPEVVAPDAKTKIELLRVSGVNPEY